MRVKKYIISGILMLVIIAVVIIFVAIGSGKEIYEGVLI